MGGTLRKKEKPSIISEWAYFPILTIIFLTACKTASIMDTLQIKGFAMATTYSIVVPGVHSDSETAEKLRTEIPAAIAQIENSISIFEPESEISRFNATSTTDWFPVSEETAGLVETSLEISRETGGAFDITVGSAVELWGFGPDKPTQSMKSEQSSSTVSVPISYQKLELRFSPPALRKSLPDMQLDLSGIAKGYAVDRVAMIIGSYNLHNYKVDIGGDLRTAGLNADETYWKIGIAAPVQSTLEPVLQLTDTAVATSGDYRNFRQWNNQRLSHFIDPKTGKPTEQKGLSVTVVDDQCVRADALATAMAVLGSDKGYVLAAEKNWKVYFIYFQDGTWFEQATAAINPLFITSTPSGNYPAPRE
ncbi:MAG: FAD:protein FMN transferase [Acidobacteriota bacterium]